LVFLVLAARRGLLALLALLGLVRVVSALLGLLVLAGRRVSRVLRAGMVWTVPLAGTVLMVPQAKTALRGPRAIRAILVSVGRRVYRVMLRRMIIWCTRLGWTAQVSLIALQVCRS
jgi:hypothetical protein